LDVPVVVLAADEEAAEGAWAAGVHSLLSRRVEPEPLARALLATSEGLAVLDPMLASVLLRSTPRDDGTPLDPLTPREIEVLQLVAEGLPNKGIAARLGVSEHTAKFHVNAILRKLGAQSRTEAVVRATRRGLILL
jgi:two-component system, NarL family, nitrate/nitrite response regulator NarL